MGLRCFSEDSFKIEADSPDDERFNTKKEYFTVQLFSSKLPISTLRVVVGLKKDYETRTEKINLKPMKGVYFPLGSFYNCDSLP